MLPEMSLRGGDEIKADREVREQSRTVLLVKSFSKKSNGGPRVTTRKIINSKFHRKSFHLSTGAGPSSGNVLKILNTKPAAASSPRYKMTAT